ncbi:MAG: hypothetical protein NT070_04025 [Cyanobacteria bacterium]|nr:hypothetical protein [Cyanobacteriota bacterium]
MVTTLATGRCIVLNITTDVAFILYDSPLIGLYPVESTKCRPTQQHVTPL